MGKTAGTVAGILALGCCLAFSGYAAATTSFHECQPLEDISLVPIEADMENIELYIGETQLPIISLSEMTLSDRHGFCTAKNGHSYKWQLREYISKVATRADGEDLSLMFLCSHNNSAVPAGVDECENTITQDSQLVPTYVDNAGAGKDEVLYSDIQTSYATAKGQCGKEDWSLVKIASHRISGPQFDCAVSKTKPAGTGLVSVEAICSVDGTTSQDDIVLDLGNSSDHFELSLPGRDEWLKLYPCSPVPGLQN